MSLARIPLKVTLTIEDRDRNIQPDRRTFLAHGTFPFREELLMLKALYAALVMVAAGGIVAVQAQTVGSGAADAASRRHDSRLLNENYLAPTGETVPHPGASQGAATTDLDRRIEQKNNRLDQSICSNCN